MNRPNLANNGLTRADIVSAAERLGCKAASSEHPGYVRIATLNGRIAGLGTVNGPWEFDTYDTAGQEVDGDPVTSIEVPETHTKTAEGLARFVVGTLAGIYEYRAYPTERAMLKAKKAERMARDGR